MRSKKVNQKSTRGKSSSVIAIIVMADGKQQPGLVKKLLFPAYTDAGSNDNFTAPPQDDGTSDATTAVLDNRTAFKPQQHEVQYDGDRVAGYAPSADSALNDSLLTETGRNDDSLSRTRFFLSTDPPTSPPPPPKQRPIAGRSLSTTTRSGIRPFPTTSPRVSLPETDRSVDQSSTTANSVALSSVVGLNFLNDSDADKSGYQAFEQDPTPVRDNRSVPEENGDSSRYKPRLAYLGDEARSDVLSDVNSTASEMGTVIDAPGRLEEVQAMADFMERNDPSLYEADSKPADIKRSPAKDVPGLSLPTLDERSSDQVPPSAPSSRDEKNSVFREKLDLVFRERGESPPPAPEESPSSATAMVSAALRRLGSGVGNLSRAHSNKSPTNVPGPYSAPNTPRVVPPSPKVEDSLRLNLPARSSDPSSSAAYLLRSPGSAVHFQSDGSRKTKRPNLAPRLSDRFHRGSTQFGEATRADSRPSFRQTSSLASPLRFARGCLSFDNTFDEKQPARGLYATPSIPESEPQSPPGQWRDYPQSPSPRHVVQSRSWDVNSGTSSMYAQIRETPTTPLGYRSFTFGKSPVDEASTAPSAFRSAPLSRVRHANGMNLQLKQTDRYTMKNLSNISPAVADASETNTLALRTPQRIEIEREDALDILACLVERSVAFDQERALSSRVDTIEEADENANQEEADVSKDTTEHVKSSSATEKMELIDDDRVSTLVDIGVRPDSANETLQSPPKNRRTPQIEALQTDSFSSDLTDVISMIRKISQEYSNDAGDGESSCADLGHSTRMKAVDELLRSHTYAAEMRRAAKSASIWLHSIRRSDGSANEKGQEQDQTNENLAAEIAGTVPVEQLDSQTEDETRANQSAGEEQESELLHLTEKMNIVALKAMLHSAELKAREREETARRLNEELSQCRAEIGRLKSASRAEVSIRTDGNVGHFDFTHQCPVFFSFPT